METAQPLSDLLGTAGADRRRARRVRLRRLDGRRAQEPAASFGVEAPCSRCRAPSSSPKASPSRRCSTGSHRTLDRLANAHLGQTFVAFSHADPIKAAIASVAGVPLDLFQRFVVSPCSVTALVRGPATAHVLCVNTTSSLSELVLS